MQEENRIHSLDSLRGIAAVTVVTFHCLLSFPSFYNAYFIQNFSSAFVKLMLMTPLHTFWAGSEAVLLFFVLSGFVLSLPFLKGRRVSYKAYIIKRFFRIYIPYIVVMLCFSAILTLLNDYNKISALSPVFNERWTHPVTWKSIISYFLMAGYDMTNVNGVVWSLNHEMRISIAFPLIIFFVRKFRPEQSLAVGTGTSLLLWYIAQKVGNQVNGELLKAFVLSFSGTFYYCTFFVIGAILAKYRSVLGSKIAVLKGYVKFLLFATSILLINFKWTFFPLYKLSNSVFSFIKTDFISDMVTAAGILLLFAVVINSGTATRLLTLKPVAFLGKISYSIYLIHILPIMLCERYLGRIIGLMPAIAVAFILAILIAAINYRFVELPSMTLGKRLAYMSTDK